MQTSGSPVPKFVRATARGQFRLAELFTQPPVYGVSPSMPLWSPSAPLLAFLWNQDGGLLQDIWVSSPDAPPTRTTSAADIEPSPVEDDKRVPADVEHDERIRAGITEYIWSDEGGRLFFVCRGDLYRIDPSGGGLTALVRGNGGIHSLAAVPGTDGVSFLMQSNVWVLDPARPSLRRLTFFGQPNVAVSQYAWSPDGSQLAVGVHDTSEWETVRMPDYTPADGVKINELRRNNVGKPLAKWRVGVVPSDGGLLRRIALELPGEGPISGDAGEALILHALGWTWDGRHVVASYTGPWYRDYRVVAAPADDLEHPVAVVDETELPWFARTAVASSPDGRHLYFASARDGWSRAYRVPIEGGKPQPVTPSETDLGSFAVPRRGECLVFSSWEPDPRDLSLWRAEPDGRDRVAVDSGEGNRWFSVSDDGRRIAAVHSRVMRPPTLFRVDTVAGPDGRTLVVDSATERFSGVVLPRVERFSFPFTYSKTGGTDELRGKMIMPAGFDPSLRYPVVLSCVYAGQGKDAFGRYQLLDTWMANEMGYISVGLDLRASPGYGHRFLTGYYKSLGVIDSEELVRCADHMRGLPYVDPERIGIWGGSYGGFLVLMVMCNHPGVFHTGVSFKPVTDWRNYWDGYTAPRLTRPDDDPAAYEACSPVYHAAGLQGNLLIVHGMQDDNVLFQDCAWMIQRLIEAGKYFDLMVYPRDNHGLTLREESLPDCMERIAAYFEEHMGLGPSGD